jgi:uncharacterized 2Fe-2S/4Fe-4S cluster protein (DUF4445 family)
MREAEIRVKFEPHGATVYALKNTKIVEAAARAGITLNTPCGGRGTCRKCRVRVLVNACEPTEAERAAFSDEEIAEGFRLACQSPVCGPTTIEVLETSILASAFQILGGARDGPADVSDAAVRKRYIELSAPGREDEAPDIDRIQRAIGPCSLDLGLLRQMPARLRAWGFRGTAVLADHRLVDFEQGNTETECYAAAFDIGTTTLVGVLIDLVTGHERASVSRMNPQTSLGDDVISRILFARQDSSGLGRLHDLILTEVNDMIGELAAQARIPASRIYEATFAGNTTMQHLLEGVDPSALGEIPFTPATGHGLMLPASDLGLAVHDRGRVYVFPIIGGFVGGDTVAGIVATGLADVERPTVLVDIGTNGEIVVCRDGRMMAASTAAGPAFEGARIAQGMRATAGAIEKVLLDDDVRINVIGDVPPVGLCGSALIDAVAELLRHGVVMSQGILLRPDDLPKDLPLGIRERVISTGEGPAFVLASAEETRAGAPVLLTQKDIRELQLATAAIRAGFSILLRRVGLRINDIDRVLIAGGFGNFIRRSNAQRIGLLPTDLERHRITFVGNTALAGARLAAVSQKVRRRAEELARRTQHVDLSMDPEFHTEYVSAMFFPERVR